MTLSELWEIEHVGFALYGFSSTACPVARVYEWAVDWFSRLGGAPDKAGGDPGGRNSGKYKSFRSFDRKVRASNFAGVTNWNLLDIPDDCRDNELDGLNMEIYYGIKRYIKCLVFHVRGLLLRDRMPEFMEAARQACELLHPRYGIGYRRPLRLGPLLYGMSMQQNGVTHPIEFNMTYWSRLNDHEAYMLLRDVCPWNFFTATQLDLKVGGIRLEDWIRADPDRGTLSRFTDQVSLWTVPVLAIPPLRVELLGAGIILDHQRDIVAKMREYHVDDDTVIESLKTGKPLEHRPAPRRISEEEMLGRVLGAFGGPDSQVLKVEQGGKPRELSESEIKEARDTSEKKKGKPSK